MARSASPRAADAASPLAVVMDSAPFPCFAKLLEACSTFASLTGGRYTCELFQDFQGDGSNGDEARFKALPVVTEFSCRIAEGKCQDSLLPEFRVAERMVLREAVVTSMVSTCRSLDLWPAKAHVPPDDISYQDMSDPLDCIAQRLYNFIRWRAATGEEEPNKRRMFAASFVVEFGRSHGLPPGSPDSVAEKLLFGFLGKVKDWGEQTRCQELAPCLESLPPTMRQRAESWWKANWKGVAVGVGIFAAGIAVLGMATAASAAYVAAKNGSERREHRISDGEAQDSEPDQNSH